MRAATRKSLGAAALAAIVTLPVWTVRAQSSAVHRENARALWADGNAKRAQGDHKAALRSFEAAHALVGLPATGIEVAREREATGLLIEARDMALAVARMTAGTPDDERAVAEGAALYRRLEPRIPSIEIAVSGIPVGTPYRVRIDGAAIPDAALTLPWRVNPGTHTIAVGAEGHRVGVQTVTVPESTKKRVEVRLSSLSAGSSEVAAALPRPAPARPSPDAVTLHIRSSDPTVGLYQALAGRLVCRAPCGSIIDPGLVGTVFYFEGNRTPASSTFSIHGMSGSWTAAIGKGSSEGRIAGGVLIGLGSAAGLAAIVSSFIGAAAPGSATKQAGFITTLASGLSATLTIPIGIAAFVESRTTFTLKSLGAP